MTTLEPSQITSPEIAAAEQAILDAKQIADDLRQAEESKRENLKHLRALRDRIAARLARLQNRDLGAQLAQSERIFDDLFESSDLTSPNRRIELESATFALAWLPAAMKRQSKLIEHVKSELTALESGK